MVDRKEPPTEIWEMNSAENTVPMGLELASSATEIPLKPMPGRLVEFSGFHLDTLDRKNRPAPKPASAPAMAMERMMFFFSLIPA